MSHQAVPLAEFSNWHDTVKGVEIRASLPAPEGMDLSTYAVNVGRLATMARWGRFDLVNIGLGTHAPSDSSGPDGLGMVDYHITPPPARYLSFPKAAVSLAIDGQQEPPADTPATWAHYLDTRIRSGLEEAARDQLFMPERQHKLAFVINATGALVAGSIVGLVTRQPEAVPIVMVGLSLSSTVTGRGKRAKQAQERGLELPLDWGTRTFFPGLPADRHTMLRLAGVKPLITPV